jgi:hypothetical protein
MAKTPELLEPKERPLVKEKEIKELTPEEEVIMRESVVIEREVIKRSSLTPKEWIERYPPKFRILFDANKEKFIKLHKKDPEVLYELIKQALE